MMRAGGGYGAIKTAVPTTGTAGRDAAPLLTFGFPETVSISGNPADGVEVTEGAVFLAEGGAYHVGFGAVIGWRVASRIELRAVVGGDPRFRGPLVAADGERTEDGPAPVLRTLTAAGLVVIPAGAGQTRVELWARAVKGGGYQGEEEVAVEFAELWAVRVGDAPAANGKG